MVEAELNDILEVDLGGIRGVTRIKLCTEDSVTVANQILAEEEGWRLIKDEDTGK